MGQFFSRLWDKLFTKNGCKIVMVGLDNAGKTTIMYRLKLGEVITTAPTIGFNVETIEYKNVQLTCWDIGGQSRIRPLWYHYYLGTDAIIFVIDSSDADRTDDSQSTDDNAKYELQLLLQHEDLKNAILLVLANKQDLKQAQSIEKIAQKIGLDLVKDRLWHIQGTKSLTGEGLYEGLDWLITTLQNREKKL